MAHSAHIHTQILSCPCMLTHSYTHTPIHSHIHTYSHTYTNTSTHTHIHPHIFTHTDTHKPKYLHTSTCLHTHTRTPTHPHTLTHPNRSTHSHIHMHSLSWAFAHSLLWTLAHSHSEDQDSPPTILVKSFNYTTPTPVINSPPPTGEMSGLASQGYAPRPSGQDVHIWQARPGYRSSPA